jgi:SAM-dependent methyltransferase
VSEQGRAVSGGRAGDAPLYDRIGIGYRGLRREEPRIAEQIRAALAGCASVVNVGAGAGSYEPRDRRVVAVEPSLVMIRQRPVEAAPVVRGSATSLPFRDGSFDAALAVLTIHHWGDVGRGLAELRRVARRRVVILTFDTSVGGFWLTDYFPEILQIDAETMPAMAEVRRHLGPVTVTEVPVPHDCIDGFLGAYWRRPEAYLSPHVRSAISVFARVHALDAGVAALQADLESGAWHRRYGHLLGRAELDLGYRLVVAA